MKMHFIKKYNVDPEIKRNFERQYNLNKFTLAYKWGSYAAASESIAFLKSENAVTMKMRLKMLFLQLPFLRKTLINIKKLYVSKTSLSRL